MRKLWIIFLLCSGGVVLAQVTPSYWWSQMLVKPDAKRSQEFWFVPGQGVYFTFQTNHVIINSTGGGGVGPVGPAGPTGPQGPQGIQGVPGVDGTNGTSISGLTTNLDVIFGNGSTNTLFFTNGILFAINLPSLHLPSLILPGGGYLIQPNLGSLLLP